MLCISINQESRRLALVDMHNAGRQCDLLEMRLDRFGMAPEIADLLGHKPRPIIMSCRRQQDGGHWDGTEAERLALLRQCIVNKADYVEIELDAADEIKRMPPTKRVIAYHVKATDRPADILKRYKEAQKKDPDVIKFITQVKTPEQAWPFVQILSKPAVPTVVMGVGKPGIMLTILGRKIGAPWTYAALEKGMEAYADQPSVRELNEVYHYARIGQKTRLIGVTGFGEVEYYTVAGLNAALAHLELSARCLPLAVGSEKLFAKIIDAVKLAGVVVGREHQEMLHGTADKLHPSADFAGRTDLLLEKRDQMEGFYTAAQGALGGLAGTIQGVTKSDQPLKDRVVLVIGINAEAQTLAAELMHRKAGVILASHDKKAGQAAAKKLNCRFVQWEAVYNTMHDVLIICDEEKDSPSARGEGLHPGVFKDGAFVLDLTSSLRRSPQLIEARERGGRVVPPRNILLCQLQLQTKILTGKDVPLKVFAHAVPDLDED